MELKNTDLRIGNLLQDKVSKTTLKVVELNENDIVTYVIDRSKFPLEKGWALEPIPLSEKWLVDFGFEKIKDDFFDNESRLSIWRDSQSFDGFLCDWADTTIKQIKYVHELQNLNFSLCNTELQLSSKDGENK